MTTSASIVTDRADTTRAHAPGKLILSGEHSVLYGAPAVAMALAHYTEVWFRPVGPGEGLKTAFDNLSSGAFYPFKVLSHFKSSLDQRFDQFMRGELAVHKILTRPDDLAVYTLASLLQDHPDGADISIPGLGAMNRFLAPGQLGSRSGLPIGAGLGSSAAVVAATTVLFEHLLERHKSLEARYERVRFCERLKHGRAGPIDAGAVVRGGLVRAGAGVGGVDVPPIAPDHGLVTGQGWYWVLHGRPESSTGECVSAVRAAHAADTALWDSFGACTRQFLGALANGTDPDPAIRENQRLLEHIGIVPEATRDFVRAIEATGAAAKVCGAGAVRGDRGGVVLVHMDDAAAMSRFMEAHPDLRWSPLRMARAGAAFGPAPVSGGGSAPAGHADGPGA